MHEVEIPEDFLGSDTFSRVDQFRFSEMQLGKLVWCPSLTEVTEWSREQISAHHVTKILYYKTPAGEITRLSFSFSDGFIAPKKGTYNFSPNNCLIYPQGVSILQFSLTNTRLYCLVLLSPD